MNSNSNSPTLEYAIAERDKCAAYLAGDGPDKFGAFMGWADWSVEIRILREGDQ